MYRIMTGTLALLVIAVTGCSDELTTTSETTMLASVTPAGGETGVSVNTTVEVEFTHPMQMGMEAYAALHEGGMSQPLAQGDWRWSDDMMHLMFHGDQPLMAGMDYTIHLGGGMLDADGSVIDMEPGLQHMGGHWATAAMMGGMMNGLNMMGEGWQHENGSFGMGFVFSTASAAALTSVVPAAGEMGVDPNTPIEIEFTHPMQMGMQMYVALHEGGPNGPTVEGSWTWSSDMMHLTFEHTEPLESQMDNTIHIGGGMRDAEGNPIDWESGLQHMGGEWCTADMLGGMMNHMMGQGWMHENGTYGMGFTFRTG
jgi:hypothetical protein